MSDKLGIVRLSLTLQHILKIQRFIDLSFSWGDDIGQEQQTPHLRTTAFRKSSG